MREVKIGELYQHFKGHIYKILLLGVHTETLQKMVIYQDTSDKSLIWCRPYDDFVSEVDKEKYPFVEQKYKFERIE